jgi:2-polyprenyl-3-methyl-5-hydroxy-6-metoxy-1,4-benzoquinol methylase
LPRNNTLSNIYGKSYHYHRNALIDRVIRWHSSFSLSSDIRFIKKHIKSGRVLDIGFGRGNLLSSLGRNWDKYGFEPFVSDSERSYLEEKLEAKISNSKTLKGNYPSDFFDLVVLRNVIEHVVDFKNILLDIRRILRRGGFLFIRTPNIDSLDFHVFRASWYAVAMAGHVVFFPKKCISTIAKDLELEIVQMRGDKMVALLSFYRSMKIKYKGRAVILKGLFLLFSIVYWAVASLFSKECKDLRVMLVKPY